MGYNYTKQTAFIHINNRIKIIFIFSVLFLLLDLISFNATGEGADSGNKSFTNSIGMKFVHIAPGSFMMGSSLKPSEIASKYGGSAEWYDDEIPQHSVTLTKAFYIQTTEVTQGQWKTIMGNNPSGFDYCGKNCPVEKVSWHDVQKFIEKLNKKEGTNKYRLPTEAEWEYACRAGSTTVFYFGSFKEELNSFAWNSSNSSEWTHSIRQKKPNAWGLYDMHGNVGEWCSDWYGDYTSDSMTDPVGPEKGNQRVFRGGSWRNIARFCRSAYRYGVDPNYRRPTGGFRVVKNP